MTCDFDRLQVKDLTGHQMHISTSLLAGIVALSTPIFADQKWNCNSGGGPGWHSLRVARYYWDQLYTEGSWDIGAGWCAVSECEGMYFGLCNDAGVSQIEYPYARTKAEDTDPGNGNGCKISPNPIGSGTAWYMNYIWGTTNSLWLPPKTELRKC